MLQALPYRKAHSVKTAETALSLFLAKACYPDAAFFARFRDQILLRLPPKAFYRGKKIVIVDPTTYPKRSRRGKENRQMQYIGRVKVPLKNRRGENTCPGYLDIWSGVLLKGRKVLPLARKLCSSQHPQFVSQNLLEEAVIWQSLAAVGWDVWSGIGASAGKRSCSSCWRGGWSEWPTTSTCSAIGSGATFWKWPGRSPPSVRWSGRRRGKSPSLAGQWLSGPDE